MPKTEILRTDLVDILKEIGRLTNQQKSTNRKLDELNRKFDLVIKAMKERNDKYAAECESEQSGESPRGDREEGD